MAVDTQKASDKVKIEIDTKEMTPQQIRLLRTLNTLMVHVLHAEDEEQYFEGSAELIRVAASLITQAKFNEETKKHTSIPYAQQVLEYSMDILSEYMEDQKVVAYDN